MKWYSACLLESGQTLAPQEFTLWRASGCDKTENKQNIYIFSFLLLFNRWTGLKCKSIVVLYLIDLSGTLVFLKFSNWLFCCYLVLLPLSLSCFYDWELKTVFEQFNVKFFNTAYCEFMYTCSCNENIW